MPPLKVKIKREGRAVILSVCGELDIASAPVLTERAGRALQEPAGRLELDLSGLTFIDCAGARALGALKKTVPRGCPVLVRGASRRVRKVLAIIEAPLETPAAREPGRGPGSAGAPAPAGSRAAALTLEAQALASWAEQARMESRSVIAGARTSVSSTRSLPAVAGSRG